MSRDEALLEAAQVIEKIPYHVWQDATRAGALEIARVAFEAFERRAYKRDEPPALSHQYSTPNMNEQEGLDGEYTRSGA